MSEANMMRSIMKAVSSVGARVFRFNTGLAWVGRVQREPGIWKTNIYPSDVVIRNARPFNVGITGGADLIGWTPIKITESMVGKTIGFFTAIEVKSPNGRRTKEQQNFIDQVNANGGIGFFAESEDQALLYINSFRFNKF